MSHETQFLCDKFTKMLLGVLTVVLLAIVIGIIINLNAAFSTVESNSCFPTPDYSYTFNIMTT